MNLVTMLVMVTIGVRVLKPIHEEVAAETIMA
jgi:hypothetical protein